MIGARLLLQGHRVPWRLGQRGPRLLRKGRLLPHRRVLGIVHEPRRIHRLGMRPADYSYPHAAASPARALR